MKPKLQLQDSQILCGVVKLIPPNLYGKVLHLDHIVVEDCEILLVQCLELSKHVVHDHDGEEIRAH